MRDVTLYIPCYNAAPTIGPCLEAVFRQSYPVREVVVVDDGSTDDTREIISRYPARLITHRNNRGVAAARNTAIRNVRTDFVASLDSDCLPEKDWLKTLMERFTSPSIAGAGGTLLDRFSSRTCDLWRSVHMKKYWEDHDVLPAFLFGSNTVFRRETLVSVGLYEEDFKTNYEDVDLSCRLRQAGYSLLYEHRAVAYHQRQDSLATILDKYWKWQLGFYSQENFYADREKFISKVKENIGLANRYLEEDMDSGRTQLLYLDFLLVLHHAFKDLQYFTARDREADSRAKGSVRLSSWLALLDLMFFYRFDPEEKKLSTLLSGEPDFFQNFFAFNLMVRHGFPGQLQTRSFLKIFLQDMLSSVYQISDAPLSEWLLNLVQNHGGWEDFLTKRHPHLDSLFLESLFSDFRQWLADLKGRFPGVMETIQAAAEATDRLS